MEWKGYEMTHYIKLAIEIHGLDAGTGAPEFLQGWLKAATKNALEAQPNLFGFRDEFESDITVTIEETAP